MAKKVPEKVEAIVSADIKLTEQQYAALWAIINSQQITVALNLAPLVSETQQIIKDSGVKAGFLTVN